jgi:hypothetical protein
MSPETVPPVVAHAIQLAVAPVFLLTGISALLGVMTGRLARVIDRARLLGDAWPRLTSSARAEGRLELRVLEHRRHLACWSINLCTAAALMICLVIVTLFAEEWLGADLRWVAGSLFSAAMVAIIGGLTTFLREVYVATHANIIDPEKFDRELSP